jgi:hypothetical protein
MTGKLTAPASAGGVRPAGKHSPGGARLGQEASADARRLAAAVLEVLAGARAPAEAASALGVSLVRYYQVEARALRALVAGCEARPRGRSPSLEKELAVLRQENARLGREAARQQALLRAAQRAVGLAPPGTATGPPAKKGRRRRQARALGAAARLQAHGTARAATAAPEAAS